MHLPDPAEPARLGSPLRTAVTPIAVLLLAAVLGGVPPLQLGQGPVDAVARTQDPKAADAAADASARARKAIAEFEALEKERGKEPQRARALQWLGEIDAPEVTAFLRQRLVAAGDTAAAMPILQAIARVPRKELEAELWDLVVRPTALVGARRAAVTALAGLGDRTVDRLVGLVLGGDAQAARPVREAVTAGLLATRNDRTLRALVPLLERGPASERLADLRLFEPVRDLPPLSLMRAKLVRDDDLAVAALAWRQLAVEGHERARALTLDVVERLPEATPPAVAADVIRGLCLVRDADFYPVILRLGTSKAAPVKQALRDAAGDAAGDAALLQFLIDQGLTDERPDARQAARDLLQKAPASAVQPLLAKVRAALKRPKAESLDMVVGLHDLLRKDPSWRSDLLALAAQKDSELRTVGLSLLLDLGADDARDIAQKSLGAKEWPLRSIAYRYLGRFRDVGSIPLLIARYGKEEGRLADELDQALFRHTGTRCWTKRDWDTWWRERGSGFVLPHEQTVQKGSGASGGGGTSAYYDIPLVSNRITFLVDHSGSMNAQVGTDKKFTRLEAAKRQLAQTLEALPAKYHCNLIPYETAVRPLWKELQPLNNENRKEILDRVAQLRPAGGTNIFDSLEIAFADPSVDTIYLLTDGEPSAGRLTDVGQIVAEVRRWHRSRQVVVHCISIGLESNLLKQIAEITGGEFRAVK